MNAHNNDKNFPDALLLLRDDDDDDDCDDCDDDNTTNDNTTITTTIIGYGALLSERSSRLTFPNLVNFRYVKIKGYRRVFRHPHLFLLKQYYQLILLTIKSYLMTSMSHR